MASEAGGTAALNTAPTGDGAGSDAGGGAGSGAGSDAGGGGAADAAMNAAAPVSFALGGGVKTRRGRVSQAGGPKRRRAGGAVDTAAAAALGFDTGDGGDEWSDAQPEAHLARSSNGAVLTLEDTAGKVARLKGAGVALAEAGRFRAAVEQWDAALRCLPPVHTPSRGADAGAGAGAGASAVDSAGTGAGAGAGADAGAGAGPGAGAGAGAGGGGGDSSGAGAGAGADSSGGGGTVSSGGAAASASSTSVGPDGGGGAAGLLEMKAQALMELGEYFPAVQAAELAVQASPGWTAAWETLGRARLNFGELELAVAAFNHALRDDPRSDVAEDLAFARQQLQRRDELLRRRAEVEAALAAGQGGSAHNHGHSHSHSHGHGHGHGHSHGTGANPAAAGAEASGGGDGRADADVDLAIKPLTALLRATVVSPGRVRVRAKRAPKPT